MAENAESKANCAGSAKKSKDCGLAEIVAAVFLAAMATGCAYLVHEVITSKYFENANQEIQQRIYHGYFRN